MALNFPNPTRSFDEMRKAVGFVGHDGLFEIKFFVEAGALAEGAAKGGDISEASCLSAFDSKLAAIHEKARKAYSSKRLRSYTLSASDLR